MNEEIHSTPLPETSGDHDERAAEARRRLEAIKAIMQDLGGKFDDLERLLGEK